MKKLSVLASFFAIALVMSHVSFAQSVEEKLTPPATSVCPGLPAATADQQHPSPHTVAFGYPPFPSTAEGYPAYGAPYSYPRATRRANRTARLAPPQFQPHPLQAPAHAFVSNAPVATQPVAVPADRPYPPGQPTVFYRPTPIKNFMSMITAPRPYIGFDPYAGYPPFPGYIPPQGYLPQ